MNIGRNKIIWDIMVFVTVFPCLKSTYFDTIEWLDQFVNMWKLFALVIVLLILVAHKVPFSREQVRLIRIVIIYNCIVVASGVINQIRLADTFVRVLSQFTSVLLCIVFLKYAKESFFDVMFFLAEVFVYVNLVLMLLYPGGMYRSYYARNAYLVKNWFLGNKNTFFTYYIIFFTVATLFIYYKKRVFRSVLMILTMGISTILSSSSTLIISYSVLLLFAIMALCFDMSAFLNGRVLTIASVALFFVIVIFRYFNHLSVLFGKTTTLTGRTVLWDMLFGLIKKRLVFGYGYSSETLVKLSHTQWALHAHNTFLQCLYEGGVVELAVYLILIFLLAENLYKFRNYKEGLILSVSFFAFNFASITEFYSRGHIYILVGMIIGLENIVEKKVMENIQGKKEEDNIVALDDSQAV